MTDWEKKCDQPGAPPRESSRAKGRRRRGQEHLYGQGPPDAMQSLRNLMMKWLLPQDLVHAEALLPPWQRFYREQTDIRPVKNISLGPLPPWFPPPPELLQEESAPAT